MHSPGAIKYIIGFIIEFSEKYGLSLASQVRLWYPDAGLLKL